MCASQSATSMDRCPLISNSVGFRNVVHRQNLCRQFGDVDNIFGGKGTEFVFVEDGEEGRGHDLVESVEEGLHLLSDRLLQLQLHHQPHVLRLNHHPSSSILG